jgi:uncharacterized protein (DUF2252 family)
VATRTATPTANRAATNGRVVAHLTPEERTARGRAARTEVPRSSHAAFEPLATRRDPIDILEEQAVTRVPELVPIRYGRMLTSAFAFFRGAAAVMAADLAGTPRSGLWVQACGDAHLSNFGLYRSPERRLVFDINDFDETLPGPWEWDVKRLTASLAIAGRDNGFDAAQRARVVLDTVRAYRESMNQFATMRNLDVWYARLDADDILRQFGAGVPAARIKASQKVLDKALGSDSLQAYAKLTTVVDGRARFISDPPLVVPIEELVSDEQRARLEETIRGALRAYRRTLPTDRRHLLETFEFMQVARKVVGVGSVGTRAWIVLLLGRDQADPLLLQVKEAQMSVLEPYTGRSEYTNSGQRVVAGQHLMQATSDIFLGWQHLLGIDDVERDFYTRQLRDGKGSAPIEAMVPLGMAAYGRACGWTLARAHARSGDRIAVAAYLGRSNVFDRAMVDFSEAYADQNVRDHAALAEAVRTGRVEARSGL